tara:strand:+ start:774 stop:1049 length:276 start_codon:yes stop_codon:yes gene_type:complete
MVVGRDTCPTVGVSRTQLATPSQVVHIQVAEIVGVGRRDTGPHHIITHGVVLVVEEEVGNLVVVELEPLVGEDPSVMVVALGRLLEVARRT